MNFKGVIFDCDGTLVDTLGDIAYSMNAVLKNRGFPVIPDGGFEDKVGWGFKKLTRLCLPPDKQDEKLISDMAAELARVYAENPLRFTKPYPGIPELVAELKRRKVKTAVLTNKHDPVAQLVIGGLFPQGSFDIIQGEIEGRPRKPDPASAWDIIVALGLSPRDIIFAGDSEIDIETALNSSCHALGVSWGYRTREEILAAGAQRIIDRPDELLKIL